MVQRVGLRRQKRLRQYLRVLKPVEVRDGEKFIGVYPAENFSVCYTINFPHPMIGEESICVDLSRGDYAQDIAPARTFGFLDDVQALRNMGLIRGASERNAIVLTRVGIQNGPLRFADEFVRHKVLDLIGDLSLIGYQVMGRVVADRAGHAMHTALVSRLLRDTSSWELATLGESAVLPEMVGV
jgi:UDP-3-O-[3-hydroxymyristoyl] N-acetylglucosamine deacetylase